MNREKSDQMHVLFPDMHCCPEDKITFCRDVSISLAAAEALKFATFRVHNFEVSQAT